MREVGPLGRPAGGASRARPGRIGPRVALAVLVALAGAAGGADGARGGGTRGRRAFAAMPTRTITVERDGQAALRVEAKVAESAEQQAAGFQCATPAEIERHLILFDFGDEVVTQFHMSNVPAPLDIAFVKGDGRIFSILLMDPGPGRLYGPMGAFRFALEARKGFYRGRGIAAGKARLRLSSPGCVPGQPGC